jgi:predicted ArsR family transcriptional regulator
VRLGFAFYRQEELVIFSRATKGARVSDAPEAETATTDELAAVGALAEPSRRALYEYVSAQHDWVSREQAADAVGLQRGIAAHHLDRLAHDGLLEVDYQRLSGRRGPGAGRPAKVYRRGGDEIGVSLPPRRYELAGRLLAAAADRSCRDGTPVDRELDQAARREGRKLGRESRERLGRRTGARASRAGLFQELQSLGFEPVTRRDGVTVLQNCPFHHLAREHTDLVCGMNLSLLEGMLAELEGTGLRAALEPEDGCCCVRFHPEKI